jgi:hypothetical protein
MGLVLIPFLLRDGTHWAGMVTTGADPLIPVSDIEKSGITIPNVVLDWMSVSAIQNFEEDRHIRVTQLDGVEEGPKAGVHGNRRSAGAPGFPLSRE